MRPSLLSPLALALALAAASPAAAQSAICPPAERTDRFLCYATGGIDVAANRDSLVYAPATPFVAGSEICVFVDVSAEVEEGGWDQVFLRFTEGTSPTGPVYLDRCLVGEESGVCETTSSPGCAASATVVHDMVGTYCYSPTPGATAVTASVYVRTLDSQYQCGDCGDNAGSPGVVVNTLRVVGCNGFPTASLCGNGVLNGTERCDDGNTVAGDGCSATCAVEPGAVCDATGTSCAGPTSCTTVRPGPLAIPYCYANSDGPEDSPLVWTWRVAPTGAPLALDFDIAGGLELFESGFDPFYYDALAMTWEDDLGGGESRLLNAGQGMDEDTYYEVWARGAFSLTPTAGAKTVTVRFFVIADSTVSCEQTGEPSTPLALARLNLGAPCANVNIIDNFSTFTAELGGCYEVLDFNTLTAGAFGPFSGDGYRLLGDDGAAIPLSVEASPYPSTFAAGDGTLALDPQIPGFYVSNSRIAVEFTPRPARAVGLTFIDVGDIGGVLSVEGWRDGHLVALADDLGVSDTTNNFIAWRGLLFDQPVDRVVFSMLDPTDHFNADNLVVVPQADGDDDGVPDLCDCGPADPRVAGRFSEICDDGADNDCDGQTDLADADCGGTATAACATYADVPLDADGGGWLVSGDTAWSWTAAGGRWRTTSANNLEAHLETQPLTVPGGACPGDFKVDLALGGVVSTDGDSLVVAWSKNGGAYQTALTKTGPLVPATLDLTGAVAPGDALSLRFTYRTNASGFAAGPTVDRVRLYADKDADHDGVCDACDCAPASATFGADCDADGDGYCAQGTGPLNTNPLYAGCPAEYAGGNPLVGGSDCNDAAANANPGLSSEAAFCSDARDNDCDAKIDGADPDCVVITCTDADHDGYGAGAGCLGPDCNDALAACTTDCADRDGDLVADCNPADSCHDADKDGYGAGPGCLGLDCNDGEVRCALDCTTDLDADQVPDCRETCVDADGDNYGVGPSCSGLDCDDTSAACRLSCVDTDGDGVFDCKDGCLDKDHDGHGVGTACAGPDCDDQKAGCTTSCVDQNHNGTPDCAENCVDQDHDGYGIGPDCLGPDCNDAIAGCTLTCPDVDLDGLLDCSPSEACVDKDKDGYGQGPGCAGADCDDTKPSCTSTCIDADQDNRLDCDPADGCFDVDRDGYGTGLSCLGSDCDDALASCAVDCATDLDHDLVPDCAQSCVDADGDRYGAGPGCLGADCDDAAASCTTSCVDADLDQLADCKDPCLDADKDGYGQGAGCAGADCDDDRANCAASCVDGNANGTPDCAESCVDADGDGYGAGATCLGPDCDDAAASCTTSCVDTDGDSLVDCKDGCVDVDRDGFGVGSACTGPDCDDALPACTSDCGDHDESGVPDCNEGCRDQDGDGLGVGADCVVRDCDDRFPACTAVCMHSDDDGVPDCADEDDDDDGLPDANELVRGTDPTDDDSDDDGLLDGTEVSAFGTDPTKADTDGDGLGDGHEIALTATDPRKADTDAGGVPDGAEVAAGTNPLDPSDDRGAGRYQGSGCAGGGAAPAGLAALLAFLGLGLSRRRRREMR